MSRLHFAYIVARGCNTYKARIPDIDYLLFLCVYNYKTYAVLQITVSVSQHCLFGALIAIHE